LCFTETGIIDTGTTITVQISFGNAGNTPASDVTWSGKISEEPIERIEKLLPQFRDDKPLEDRFVQSHERKGIQIFGISTQREAWEPSWAFGWIGYTDVFDIRHWLPFICRISKMRLPDGSEFIGIKHHPISNRILHSRDGEPGPSNESLP
jgi:hypothetical protein